MTEIDTVNFYLESDAKVSNSIKAMNNNLDSLTYLKIRFICETCKIGTCFIKIYNICCKF